MEQRFSAFVLASVMGHSMIVNRMDYEAKDDGHEIGVGVGLLNNGEHEGQLAGMLCGLAESRRERCGPGVVIIDGGANIGTHTVTLAKFMGGGTKAPWGQVIAFEPQEWPYYALCGNLALNNCFNAAAMSTALGEQQGVHRIAKPHPAVARNFGTVSLLDEAPNGRLIQVVHIDGLSLTRLDILKLDIEGMEAKALAGARVTVGRLKPIVIAEHIICGTEAIAAQLPDYEIVPIGMDLLCIHEDDPALAQLKFTRGAA
jgi:FkbM family methyltransferase